MLVPPPEDRTPALVLAHPKNGMRIRDGDEVLMRWYSVGLSIEMVQAECSINDGLTWEPAGVEVASEGGMYVVLPHHGGDVLLRLRTADGSVTSNVRRAVVVPVVLDIQHALDFAVALLSDGTVRFWGYYPQSFVLATGTTEDPQDGFPFWEPRPVVFEGIEGIQAMAVGGEHLLAVRQDGTVLYWGDHDGFRSGPPQVEPEVVSGLSAVKLVTAGLDTSFAISEAGEAYAWGGNARGSLGLGTNEPVASPARAPALDGLRQVAVGNLHCLGLRADGTVVAWGWNGSGQLGDGTNEDRWSPTEVPGISDAVGVAARGQHSLVLTGTGEVYSFGDNRGGQIGDGSTANHAEPFLIPGLEDVVQVACGYDCSYAVGADGSVWAWGTNDRGQFGNRTRVSSAVPQMVRKSGVLRLTTSNSTVHAFRVDGTVLAWGAAQSFMAGNGNQTRDILRPRRIRIR